MPYNDYPASATRINVSNCGLYMKYSLLSPFSLFVSDRQVFLPLAVSSMRGQNVQHPQSYLPHIIFERAAQIFPIFLLFSFYRKYSQANFCHLPLIYRYHIRRNEQIQASVCV